MFVRHPVLGAFDAVLAAIAIERHAEALISADRAYGSIDDLRWVDLGSSDLGARIIAS